jgi:hypothetical protein
MPICTLFVIIGSLAKVIGASGTTCIYAPLPARDDAESPKALKAKTFANTELPCVKL